MRKVAVQYETLASRVENATRVLRFEKTARRLSSTGDPEQ
jgi:hypothetical protein